MIPRGIRRFVPPLLFDAVDFRRLWLGQTISVVGDQITQLGIPLVAVLTLGADATQMGTLTAVGLLPHLLFSLPAGVWLDRVRARRRLMIAADLGRAALIASIPVAAALGVLSMPQLYVVGFLSGSLAVVFDLSWNTLFVAVTQRDRYVEAMALLNGSRSLASVVGPTLGGLLVQLLGAPLAMLADAVVVPRVGGLPAPHRVAGAAHRTGGGYDARAAPGRARVRPGRPDHASDTAVGRHHQSLHLRG